MSKYKNIGPFTKMRTLRKWVLVVDGEEFPFDRKRHALLAAAAARTKYPDAKLFEETTCRFRTGEEPRPDQKYRIEITNRI